jgi:hypothetical protein
MYLETTKGSFNVWNPKTIDQDMWLSLDQGSD